MSFVRARTVHPILPEQLLCIPKVKVYANAMNGADQETPNVSRAGRAESSLMRFTLPVHE